MNALAKN